MRWVLLVLALAACKPELRPPLPEPTPAIVQARRVTGTSDCERTPEPPAGVIDVPALEAYIKLMSARLEICADKVDTLNERIRRSRRH